MAKIKQITTISEIKPLILAAFNSVISDKATQQLFAQRLELWNNAEALYTTTAELVGVFVGYKNNLTIVRNILPNLDYTRKSTVRHEKGSTLTTEHTGSDTTTFGQQTGNTKNIVYPDGYDGESDLAYLASEVNDVTNKYDNTLARNTTDTTTGSGMDTDTTTDFDLTVFLEKSGEAAGLLIVTIDAAINSIINPILGW